MKPSATWWWRPWPVGCPWWPRGPGELIEDGLTGYGVPPDQPEALLQHLPAALALDRLACRAQAERRFGLDAFGARLEAWLQQPG